MTNNEIKTLEKKCEKIRTKIIELSNQKTIHLSSNLGSVEICVGVDKILDKKNNTIIYDIGHQTYAHKILSNKWNVNKIRSCGGPSGFFEKDFISGHSGNALSAALGISYKNNGITTVIVGDAGFLNGQSLEALNHIFLTKQKIIVILNENQMSISKIVKGLNKKNNGIFLDKEFLQSISNRYVGIVDGNKISSVVNALKKAQSLVINGPTLVHFKTLKGKGHIEAENDVIGKFHMNYAGKNPCFSTCAGKTIFEIMKKDKDICVVNSAMTLGTGCQIIAEKYPNRYFDVGIAENHAMTFSAGLKLAKKKPVCFFYSTFLQRTYDQVLNDVVNNKTNFLTLVDRADLSSGDGQTHHGIHDVGFLKNIPNCMICSPRNLDQLKQLIKICLKEKKHTFIRYPREMFKKESYITKKTNLKNGEWEIVIKKKKAKSCLVTYGPYIDVLAEELTNVNIDIINAIFITRYKTNISNIIKKYKNIFVYERTYKGHLVNDFHKKNQSSNIYEFNYQTVPKHGSLSELDKKNKMSAEFVGHFIRKTI